MTSIVKSNCSFEPQIAPLSSLPEGPITTISPKILESILIFTNESKNTLLVSHMWNVLTFAGLINWNKQKIQQIIRLVSIQLPNTHAKCIRELEQLQDAHQSLSGHVTTFAEVRRLFLIVKGSLIGIIRKLPEETRDQLQTAIGEELPDSMKDLFRISKLDLMTVKNVDLDTFFTLLQSCQPLSIEDRHQAIARAAELDNIEFAKLILANTPIHDRCIEWAVLQATLNDNLEFVRLLLANGSISQKYRGLTTVEAAGNNNLELVKLLLANGPISQEHRGDAVIGAVNKKNPKLVKLLLANGPISKEARERAVEIAFGIDTPEIFGDYPLETVKMLLANGPISEETREKAVEIAIEIDNPKIVKLLLASGLISGEG